MPTSSLPLLLVLLTTACGCATKSTARHRVVAVLGSSTAAGTGASPGKSWVALVTAAAARDCPDVAVDNLAVPGYVTTRALPASASVPAGRPPVDPRHNLDAAVAGHPVLVLVEFPSNDAASYFPLQETLDNHRVLRDGIRAAGALDVIVGPFPRAFTDPAQVALMTGLRDALPAVGESRYLPLWADLAAADDRVTDAYAAGDGIHLDDAGHALVAGKVLASAAWNQICPTGHPAAR